MKKVFVLLISLSLLFLVGCSNGSGGSEVGDQGYDFEIENYNGESVKLSDFKGKTVFILAWTTT